MVILVKQVIPINLVILVNLAMLHTSKKRKYLRSLLPSPKYFAEKVRQSQQQIFATKVRK